MDFFLAFCNVRQSQHRVLLAEARPASSVSCREQRPKHLLGEFANKLLEAHRRLSD